MYVIATHRKQLFVSMPAWYLQQTPAETSWRDIIKSPVIFLVLSRATTVQGVSEALPLLQRAQLQTKISLVSVRALTCLRISKNFNTAEVVVLVCSLQKTRNQTIFKSYAVA
jgi:hypothetical protein